ncbi:hypothetical protein RF11_08235 [Thelohanellus kitauei]|uniref:Serpin domain-containing protein n=1 Tax=Thelohanellus kitauei TaxID=669202 RepID=A0A0C2IXV4_THEKT|nr:hypothetical protein RF11_08235 [Thelohanellus kitauei]
MNKLTLQLANHLLEIRPTEPISINGVIAYMTLSLLNTRLEGNEKFQFFDLLSLNFSPKALSSASYLYDLTTVASYANDEFSSVGIGKSGIFHSKTLDKYFELMAKHAYHMDLQDINYPNQGFQIKLINNWVKSLNDTPFGDIIIDHFPEEIQLVIINEYFIRFKWRFPSKKKFTKMQYFTDIFYRFIKVKTMRIVDVAKYYEDVNLKASVVIIQLKDQEISAVIALPYKNNTVYNLLKRMNVSF